MESDRVNAGINKVRNGGEPSLTKEQHGSRIGGSKLVGYPPGGGCVTMSG